MNRYAARAILAAAVFSAACDTAHTTNGPRAGQGHPSFAISDAAHVGNTHFYFLPPMVRNPTPIGAFDPDVTPVVDICQWNGATCSAAPIATYTLMTGPDSEPIRVSRTDEQYIVNWHTDRFVLFTGATYRIRVQVRGSTVGFADVAVLANGGQAKNIATDEYIPLVNGKTIPIKFRIERGMAVAVSVIPNPMTVIIGKTKTLTAVVTDAYGNAVTDSPLRWTVANPAVASVNAAGELTGVSVGTTSATAYTNGITASSSVTVIRPPVATVTIIPSLSTIRVGEHVQLFATPRDVDGNVLTGRTVEWRSSDTSIGVVDANGQVAGSQPGDVTIFATSEGQSGTARVTVAGNRCIALAGPTQGFWPFEEGVGTSTADLSGNLHLGSLQGAPIWVEGANGAGSALDFTQPQDLVNIRSFLSAGVSQLSVGAWVYPTSFSNTGDIAVGGISGPRIISATDGDGWAIGHAPGTGNIQVELRGIASFTLATAFPLNAWSNLAVVYDGGSVKTFLNGALVDSRPAPAGTIRQASTCTFIGNEPEGCTRQTNGNFAWQGRIDEVVTFSRALSDAEALALYQRCEFVRP